MTNPTAPAATETVATYLVYVTTVNGGSDAVYLDLLLAEHDTPAAERAAMERARLGEDVADVVDAFYYAPSASSLPFRA
jgi:hypothetical protein